jgi:hypothetical protein
MHETEQLHDVLTQAREGVHEADNAKDFLRHALVLLNNRELIPDEWLTEIVNLGQELPRSREGRPKNSDRLERVERDYFHLNSLGPLSSRPRRAAAVARMMKELGLSRDAAVKLYDQVADIYRESPYGIRGFVIKEKGKKLRLVISL